MKFEYENWCENNSNINIENKDNIKWLIWKRRNPIYCDKEDAQYPINPTEFVDDPALLYDVECWLSLDHRNYYIYRVVLTPCDLDEEKESFVFVDTTKCYNCDDIDEVNKECARWWELTEKLALRTSTIGNVVRILATDYNFVRVQKEKKWKKKK